MPSQQSGRDHVTTATVISGTVHESQRLQAQTDDDRAERAAEVSKRVHRAADHTGVPAADLETHRPAPG